MKNVSPSSLAANSNRNSVRLLCDYNNINISLIEWGKTETRIPLGLDVR